MRHLPTILTLGLLAPAAHADRFHFGSAADAKQQSEGTPAVVEGVLLREQDGLYVIRVVGGEMTLDKTLVYRVDRDALTVAQIEAAETTQRDQLAKADAQRKERIAAEAAAERRARAVAEASAKTEETRAKSLALDVDLDGLLPDYKFTPSSEVLRRLDLTKLSREIEDFLRQHGVEPPPQAQRDFTVQVDFKGLLPTYGFTIYDPVIHRVDLQGLARQVEDYLRAELKKAANRRVD